MQLKVVRAKARDDGDFQDEYNKASMTDAELARRIACLWARDLVDLQDRVARLQARIEEYRTLAEYDRTEEARKSHLLLADGLEEEAARLTADFHGRTVARSR